MSKRNNREWIEKRWYFLSLEENKAIICRLVEIFNKHDVTLLDELIAPDFVDHDFQLKSLKSFKQTETLNFKVFPDIRRTIEDIIAEGDKVWIRFTDVGTHTGEYRGIPPTGKEITLTGVLIWRIVDGKVVEKAGVYDQMDFFKQVGVIKYTEIGKNLFPEDVS